MTANLPLRTVRRWGGFLALASAFLLFVGCATSVDSQAAPGPQSPTNPEAAADQSRSSTIIWGKADSEPTETINKWQPVVDYLAANLADQGIESGVVKIAPDTDTLSKWMVSGEVDLVNDSFYPAMIVASNSQAVPLVVRNKDKSDKHAVFFTLTDSGIDSFEQLKGKTIALAELHSTSGFMLPVAYVKQQGLNLTEKSAADSPALPDEVGYVIAGDDDVAVQWVLNGTIIAGAVDNETFEDFSNSNPGVLKILAETEGMTRNSMFLANKDMDQELQDAVKTVLLNMHKNPEGNAILEENGAVNFAEVEGNFEGAWAKTRVLFELIKD